MNTTSTPFDFDVSKYPPLPSARGLFVTGTDTEIGKTLVAGAIAQYLVSQGRRVEVLKPVATGCRRQRGDLVSQDAEFLAGFADSRQMLSQIAPVRYAKALAPNVAAGLENRPVDLEAIFDAYRRLAADKDVDAIIVEGIGGLLCPITDDFWVAHLARLMRLPVVVVTRPNLGTINHTLLTLHAARSAGLDVAGVVVNRYQVDPTISGAGSAVLVGRGDSYAAMMTNLTQIEQRGRVKILATCPDEADNSVADARIGSNTQFAIAQGPWEKIVFGKEKQL